LRIVFAQFCFRFVRPPTISEAEAVTKFDTNPIHVSFHRFLLRPRVDPASGSLPATRVRQVTQAMLNLLALERSRLIRRRNWALFEALTVGPSRRLSGAAP
jgi:hypothetical protein